MAHTERLELFAPPGLPVIEPGCDLVGLILQALSKNGCQLLSGDILVIAQKIVSKSEGRYVKLAEVTPSQAALSLARDTGKDPRLVELVLGESRAVVRHRPGVIVVEHRLGFVIANAGIDASNVAAEHGDERVLLLPRSPDESAARLRSQFEERVNGPVGVIINDSIGRAWRLGAIGTCLGSAGIPALQDLRGTPDLFCRPLVVTTMGLADELSSASSILQGQGNEGRPVVVVRGLNWEPSDQTGRDLIRPLQEDMFR